MTEKEEREHVIGENDRSEGEENGEGDQESGGEPEENEAEEEDGVQLRRDEDTWLIESELREEEKEEEEENHEDDSNEEQPEAGTALSEAGQDEENVLTFWKSCSSSPCAKTWQ